MASNRNFQVSKGIDWINAYQVYSKDGFCPPNFQTWCAIAAISAACERRIWINHGRRKTFANLYVLLLSLPGAGKSSSVNPLANNILRKLKGKGLDPKMGLNFMSNQSSEAGFYDPQFKRSKDFYVGNEKHQQSPGIMLFTEAVNAIKEMNGGGTIAKALTEFYDCPEFWSKQLTKVEPLELRNVCPSMLAACTFSDLPDIIPHKNLKGGLASRFIFIPDFSTTPRTPRFMDADLDHTMRDKLVADLQEIFTMSGEIKVMDDFHEEWSYLHGKSDEAMFKTNNTQLQCLIARRFLNIEKLSIIISLAESSSMIITRAHWKRAEQLIDAQLQFLPAILEYSSIADSQSTLTEAIRRCVDEEQFSVPELKTYLLSKGVPPPAIDINVDFMLRNRSLILDAESGIVSNGIRVDKEADTTVEIDSANMETELLPAQLTH